MRVGIITGDPTARKWLDSNQQLLQALTRVSELESLADTPGIRVSLELIFDAGKCAVANMDTVPIEVRPAARNFARKLQMAMTA